jgi:hypothetical protein
MEWILWILLKKLLDYRYQGLKNETKRNEIKRKKRIKFRNITKAKKRNGTK